MSRRPIRDRKEFVLWWVAALFSVFMVGWGVYMIVEYGVNSPAAIIGLGFEVWGTYLFLKTLDLRRYCWYGDLR